MDDDDLRRRVVARQAEAKVALAEARDRVVAHNGRTDVEGRLDRLNALVDFLLEMVDYQQDVTAILSDFVGFSIPSSPEPASFLRLVTDNETQD